MKAQSSEKPTELKRRRLPRGTMDDNTNSAEQLPKAIGRFQVVSALGFGAMGAVYKAFDPLIKRTLGHQDHQARHPSDEPAVQVVHRSVPSRGADLGNPVPSEHRDSLRHRRGRWPAVSRHGVHRGAAGGGAARRRTQVQARARHRPREPGRLRLSTMPTAAASSTGTSSRRT